MTPREISGCLFFANRRKSRDAAQALLVSTMGARGDPKEVQKSINAWSM